MKCKRKSLVGWTMKEWFSNHLTHDMAIELLGGFRKDYVKGWVENPVRVCITIKELGGFMTIEELFKVIDIARQKQKEEVDSPTLNRCERIIEACKDKILQLTELELNLL